MQAPPQSDSQSPRRVVLAGIAGLGLLGALEATITPVLDLHLTVPVVGSVPFNLLIVLGLGIAGLGIGIIQLEGGATTTTLVSKGELASLGSILVIAGVALGVWATVPSSPLLIFGGAALLIMVVIGLELTNSAVASQTPLKQTRGHVLPTGIPSLVGKPANGSWTSITTGKRLSQGKLFFLTGSIVIVFMMILKTQLQGSPLSGIGTFYMVVVGLTLLTWGLEFLNVREPGSLIDFGPFNRWLISIPLGLGLGVVTGLLIMHSGTIIPLKQGPAAASNVKVSAGNLAVLSLLATVVMIPLAEEYVLSAFVTPTLAEEAGVLPGMVLTSATWLWFHVAVYHAHGSILLLLFGFRLAAVAIVYYTKSITGPIVAHIIINIISVIA